MSKNTEWTRAPWKVEKELGSQSGEWLIAYDAGDRGRGISIARTVPATGKCLPNARLIAASPDLYNALEAILDVPTIQMHLSYSMITSARKALAKARGECE